MNVQNIVDGLAIKIARLVVENAILEDQVETLTIELEEQKELEAESDAN